MNTGPFSEMRRTGANVNRDVQSFSFHHPAQFCLRMSQLVVEAAQRPQGRGRMVVLYKAILDTKRGEFVLVVSFQEKTALIPEHLRPQLKNAWERCLYSLHQQ